MERSSSFQYHKQVVLKKPAKSEISTATAIPVESESFNSTERRDMSHSTVAVVDQGREEKSLAGKRKSLEGRVVRGTKGKCILVVRF